MHALERRWTVNLIIRIGLFSRREEPSFKKSNIYFEISLIFEEAIYDNSGTTSIDLNSHRYILGLHPYISHNQRECPF